MTENNISVLHPYSENREPFEKFKEDNPDFSFMLPAGNYTFRRENDPETVDDDTIIRVYSEDRGENYYIKLSVIDDYKIFTEYSANRHGIIPVSFLVLGPGSVLVALALTAIGVFLIFIIERQFKILDNFRLPDLESLI